MKKVITLTIFALVLLAAALPFAGNNRHTPTAKPIDMADGIRIGTQRWSTTNLSTTTFENGDTIAQAATPAQWEKAGLEGKPAWCYYGNDPANTNQYGKLYNYYALTDPRGLAPEGWLIPTEKDWNTLFDFLGGLTEAGRRMKAKTGWTENLQADNICGFTATPAGQRSPTGQFGQMGSYSYLWSQTPGSSPAKAQAIMLFYNNGTVTFTEADKAAGLAIRCLIDVTK